MANSARLRSNLSANLLGTGISSCAALLSAPLIFRWLGAEAYGLVGFYLLLQALMPLFDLGITPGLARAIAWHRGSSGSEGEVATLIKMGERPIWVLALAFAAGMFALSGSIAHHWLKSADSICMTVQASLVMMGGALAFRMLSGLQKAALMALEHQVQANIVQSLAVLARTFLALVIAVITNTGVLGFFAMQLPVAFIEWRAYHKILNSVLPSARTEITEADLRRHLRFALGVAALAALWISTTQVDKLMLSRSLSLSEYGAYSLGVHIASSIIIATGPIYAAMLPRLTRLLSAGHEEQSRLLYGMATAIAVAISFSLTVGISLLNSAVLRVIKPEANIGIDPMKIAVAYAIGNVAVVIVGLSYQLQNARGRLGLHAVGTFIQALVQIPLLIWVASAYGAFATAVAFAALNWLFMAFWMPVVHTKFLDGGHLKWLQRDLLPPLLVALTCLILPWLVPVRVGSIVIDGMVAIFGMSMTLALTIISHADMRIYLKNWLLGNDD